MKLCLFYVLLVFQVFFGEKNTIFLSQILSGAYLLDGLYF